MLLLLSFLYDRTTILDARVAFSHGSSDQRAQATEAIDTLLPREMALRVLPVLDDVGIPGRAARMSRAPAEEASGDLQVLEIVERPPAGVSSWSVACAIYEGARWLGARAAASVRVSASRGDALVRETAAEMLRSIERGASSSTPA